MGRSHISEIILPRERIFHVERKSKHSEIQSRKIQINGLYRKKISSEISSEISIKILKIFLSLKNIL